MDIDDIKNAHALFPFKEVKGNRGGLKFRQKHIRKEDGTGTILEIEHNGHDHLTLDFRSLYKKDNRKIGNKRLLHWTFNTKETVQLASLLFYFAEEHMRDSAEEPFITLTTQERSTFGPNWIHEDYTSALKRTENRKSRSYLFGLMKRFVELCDDPVRLQSVFELLSSWATQSCDEFAIQQSENASAQLGCVPNNLIN